MKGFLFHIFVHTEYISTSPSHPAQPSFSSGRNFQSLSPDLHLHQAWCQPAHILLQTSFKSARNLAKMLQISKTFFWIPILRWELGGRAKIIFKFLYSKWVLCSDHSKSSRNILTTKKVQREGVGEGQTSAPNLFLSTLKGSQHAPYDIFKTYFDHQEKFAGAKFLF